MIEIDLICFLKLGMISFNKTARSCCCCCVSLVFSSIANNITWPLSLPEWALFRLSTAYLLLALARLFSNLKWEKKFELKTCMKSKVYQSFSDFLSFPFKALKLGACYFQLNLANVANTQITIILGDPGTIGLLQLTITWYKIRHAGCLLYTSPSPRDA